MKTKTIVNLQEPQLGLRHLQNAALHLSAATSKLLHKRQSLSRDPTFREINGPSNNSKNNKKPLPSSKRLGFLNFDKDPEEVVS